MNDQLVLDRSTVKVGLACTLTEFREHSNGHASQSLPTFYEFFAGGGMARAGLGPQWRCLFANDFDFRKSATYRDYWGEGEIVTKDVGKVETAELPGRADLVWASFPCQDLSLAGMGAGLKGDRSGTFWPFWNLVKSLHSEERGPNVLVLENVCGALTSHEGKDFTAIAEALRESNYRFGAVVVDASAFVPQSRPRLFFIAVACSAAVPAQITSREPLSKWHTKALQAAYDRLPEAAKGNWIWWNLPVPERRNNRFADLVEHEPSGVTWHTLKETERIIGMMGPLHLEKLAGAKKAGKPVVGTIYKRTRKDETGAKAQRAEVRFDGVAGCLRTSTGGSSRQTVIIVDGEEVRTRLLSTREAARLMGLPEDYKLPSNYNEAYHLAGDGVVVPVVRFLAHHLLEPILHATRALIGVDDGRHSVPKE